jgi:hypothetical protein
MKKMDYSISRRSFYSRHVGGQIGCLRSKSQKSDQVQSHGKPFGVRS